MRVLKTGIVFVATVAILTLVVYLVGFEETAGAITRAGLSPFLAVGLLQLLFLLLQAAALKTLSRPIGHRIRFSCLLEAAVAGMAANLITPSTYLGGEPVKVIFIGRKTGLPYGEIAGTVVLAKYMEALSFVFFLGTSIAVTLVVFGRTLFSGTTISIGITLIALAALAIVLSAAILLSLMRHGRPLTAIVEFISRPRWFRRFFARLRTRTRLMEQQVSTTFLEEGRASLGALIVYILTHVVLFLRPLAFFGLGWEMGLDFELLCLIFIASQVLLAFQVTPSAVGVLDGGLIGVLALVGADAVLSVPMVAAYLLCIRFWDAAVIGGGALIAARSGAGLLSRPPPETGPDGHDEPYTA